MQASRIFGLAMCLVKAGLTGLSGAVSTFTTGVAITYAIVGKAYVKAAIAGGATPTADAVTGKAIVLTKNQGVAVVWCLDAAGVVRVLSGEVSAMDGGKYVTSPPLFPMVPDNLCPFAYSIHTADNTLAGAFSFGTSSWSTAGTAHTATDVIVLPRRPQLA